MNFLNPLFLLGLLAVAVPVLIHLINIHRPRKVPFSTLAFFQELQKSTMRRIRIKQYLLMALRTAAVLFLALALARPFLPPTLGGTGGSDESRAIVLLVDNSPSMNRIGPSGPLMDRAKELAAGILDQAGPSDRFIVATSHGESRSGTLVGAQRARELVDGIESVNRGNYLPGTLEEAVALLDQSSVTGATVYLISDGQESHFSGLDEVSLEEGAGDNILLQPVLLGETDQQNVSVADVRLEGQMVNTGTPVELQAEVRNEGDNAVPNQYLSLEAGGEIRGEYEFSLQAGETRTFTFEMIPEHTGDNEGRVILEGDEIPFDNVRHFVIRVPESRSAAVVREGDDQTRSFRSYLLPAMEAARMTDTQLQVSETAFPETDLSDWEDSDVLVLDGLQQVPEYWFDALQRFVQQGGGILFFPSEQGEVENYNAFFGLFNGGSYEDVNGTYASFESIGRMGELTGGHPVLDELFEEGEEEGIRIDLPQLYYYYEYQEPDNTGSYVLLESASDDPLWTEQRFGEGIVLISALGTDPGWSNFPVNPLFSPLYYRSLLYAGSGEQGGIAEHNLGTPFEWQTDLTGEEVHLRLNGGEARPEVRNMPSGMRLQYPGREWEPGILEISAGDESRKIAVNQDIMESRFSTLEEGALAEAVGDRLAVADLIAANELSAEDLDRELQSASFGEEIWDWFVWLALLLLITETAVSRLYRTGKTNDRI